MDGFSRICVHPCHPCNPCSTRECCTFSYLSAKDAKCNMINLCALCVLCGGFYRLISHQRCRPVIGPESAERWRLIQDFGTQITPVWSSSGLGSAFSSRKLHPTKAHKTPSKIFIPLKTLKFIMIGWL